MAKEIVEDTPDGVGARVRRSIRWLIRLRGSPRAIAFGFAVGTFIAFTPTIGFQVVLALIATTLLGANRPAAVLATMITNPLTAPPVFVAAYYVGTFFWAGPPAAEVSAAVGAALRQVGRLEFWALSDQAQAFLELGVDVFVPMWIGGALLGALAAVPSYFLVLGAVRRYRRRRRKRKGRRPRPVRSRP